MPTVTVYADQITTTDIVTIQYDTKFETTQQTIVGTSVPSAEGVDVRDEIITEYESRGYTFDGEQDCALYFSRDNVTCDYTGRQQEIDDLLGDGWTISEANEQTCEITFSKEGLSDLTIQLDSDVTTETEIINGDFTADTEVETVDGQQISTTNEQDLIDDGYTYEGIINCKKVWSKQITYCEFDNKLKTISEYEKKGYTLVSDTGCQLIFEGTFEKCEYPDREGTIEEYQNNGFELISDTNCQLHFQKEVNTLTNETDVYAFFDTTSMEFEDGKTASTALQNWFSQYQTDNPDYEGNLYIIPIYYERYVDYLDIIKKGTAVGKRVNNNTLGLDNAAFNPSGSDWIGEVGIYPPNFDYVTAEPTNPDWTPPTDVLMLCFVDEANQDYHGGKPLSFDYDGVDQPTPAYLADFTNFKNNLEDFNFFKGVVYPIVRELQGSGGALILQSLAAIEGTTLTQSQIDATNTLVDVSIIKTENPYELSLTIDPLKEHGWAGVYDKISPASDVFSSNTFSDELNTIIQSAGTSEEQTIDEYVDGEIVSYDDTVTVDGLQKTETEYIEVEGCEIPLSDEDYFEDVSWTIAYNPILKSWISYYAFVPNYYINLPDHFKTGLNRPQSTLWSHLLTNKSYQVFYGNKTPWIIEAPITEEYIHKDLTDVEYFLDARKYSGEYDHAEIRNEGFNKAWIYNHRVNSGELNLVPQLGLMEELSDYPNTLSETSQEILYSDTRGKHRFNYFYDRVKDDRSTEPMWKWDMNQIHKSLNENAITFTQKEILDYIRGDWFTLRLQQDNRTDLRYEFKWLVSNEIARQ